MTGDWEEFTQKTNYRAEMVRVSLNGRGHFQLNQKAVDALGNPEAVVFMFDRSNRLIGIKPSTPDIEHSYELKRQGSSQNYLVRARSFCSYYSINLGDTIVFNDARTQDGMIVLDLDHTTEVVRRARLTEFPHVVSERSRPAQPIRFSNLLRMREPDDE